MQQLKKTLPLVLKLGLLLCNLQLQLTLGFVLQDGGICPGLPWPNKVVPAFLLIVGRMPEVEFVGLHIAGGAAASGREEPNTTIHGVVAVSGGCSDLSCMSTLSVSQCSRAQREGAMQPPSKLTFATVWPT